MLHLYSDIFLTDIMGCDRLNLVKYTHNETWSTSPIFDKMATATVICILVTFCYYLLERGFLLFFQLLFKALQKFKQGCSVMGNITDVAFRNTVLLSDFQLQPVEPLVSLIRWRRHGIVCPARAGTEKKQHPYNSQQFGRAEKKECICCTDLHRGWLANADVVCFAWAKSPPFWVSKRTDRFACAFRRRCCSVIFSVRSAWISSHSVRTGGGRLFCDWCFVTGYTAHAVQDIYISHGGRRAVGTADASCGGKPI